MVTGPPCVMPGSGERRTGRTRRADSAGGAGRARSSIAIVVAFATGQADRGSERQHRDHRHTRPRDSSAPATFMDDSQTRSKMHRSQRPTVSVTTGGIRGVGADGRFFVYAIRIAVNRNGAQPRSAIGRRPRRPGVASLRVNRKPNAELSIRLSRLTSRSPPPTRRILVLKSKIGTPLALAVLVALAGCAKKEPAADAAKAPEAAAATQPQMPAEHPVAAPHPKST